MDVAIALIAHELTLFAAVGFLLFGADDLLVDLIWIARTLWRRLTVYTRYARADAETLTTPVAPGRIAIFVPAWDEGDVIGPMLANTLGRLRHVDFRIFVGCYPNDPSTRAVVDLFSKGDVRVRRVLTSRDGPTTKADCLNALYRAMLDDEQISGVPYKAVVLHDAEDVVHSDELRVFDAMIERAALVQLPVLPLIDASSRWIAGHYADEFAESHGKELVVREAVGAGVPSAGVACAIRRDVLERLAVGDGPFDPASLTEDYEIGLRLAELGERGIFVRLPSAHGRQMVMTREHFPATLDTAVRQKARWMTGIALSGWDRMGWRGGVAERWMRLRDRKSVLAALFVFVAYLAALIWVGLWAVEFATGQALMRPSPLLDRLLQVNMLLFGWRLVMRFAFVTAAYGIAEGMRAIPRVVVANFVAMLAARRALGSYKLACSTGEARWEKTRHVFPLSVPAE